MPESTLIKGKMGEINILTDRVQKRKRECMDATLWVSGQRSHSYTESWKETEAVPFHLRRAKAFARVIEDSPIVIRDSELIVGSTTRHVRGAEIMMEYNPYDILEAVKEKRLQGLSEVVTAEIDSEELKLIEDDANYWVGKSTRDAIKEVWKRELGEAYFDLADYGVRVYDHNIDVSPKGSSSFNPRVLKEGLNGTIARAKSEKEEMFCRTNQAPDILATHYHKMNVLDSIVVTCEAMIKFAGKHAELARNLAKTEKDLVRKGELEEIAKRCEWVPANPARTFAEALQSLWFIHLGLMKEQPLPAGMCPGRMDQYLFPFYEQDLKEGKLTCQEAAELLGCLWVKMNELESFRGWRVNKSRAGSLLQQLTIGGQSKDGRDATNELSYLILEVSRQLKMPQPGVYVRYHNNISRELMVKAAETNRDTGGGIPAFLSDQSAVNRLLALGIKLDDAIEWNASGCLLFTIGHIQAAHPRAMGMINMPKILEITLNNGVDPRTGKKVGLQTGEATSFTSIEEIYDAFEKQLNYFADRLLFGSFIGNSARMKNYSLPLTTVLLEDCVTKGLDAYEGGERYPQLSTIWGVKGHVEIADCLSAIKQLVFEQKKITMSELLEALKTNFEGKDDLHRLCLQAPKYGNDDDYVDDIYNNVSLKTQEVMLSKRNPWTGKPLAITRPAVSAHYYYGEVVGALPNGRKAWEPLYDAGLSPMGGADVNGPTAVIRSATKINQCPPEQNGLVLNMKFSRPMLQTRKNIESFLALLKTFFDRGGWHIQFNIVNREDLIEAQKQPEQWRHLIVRVAGYSAYFVDLPPALQNEIIARTTHEM